MKMRRCEDEKMFYRPPLLEEPCAQTLSGKKGPSAAFPQVPRNSFDSLKLVEVLILSSKTGANDLT